ncbi:60S ribosome subunit biogenesis protein NIP7 [Cladobotryum mycophilum]|uniref:60S ribosome subunit biogenesis protein NIP7 n=1 Tax=Cladobotryum mycophilum TaxID=491253 RepID=A0ABR0SWN1_9HYPO
MRPLTEEETQAVFKKLAEYTGASLKNIIAPLDDSPTPDRNVFRLSGGRVYLVRLSMANLATSVARDNLLSLGVCLGDYHPNWLAIRRPNANELLNLGKFTKTGKFRVHITALPVLAEHARYKMWIKPNGVMPFLYGSNVVKAHIGRFTEDCPEHQGIVVYSMDDVPLGFGRTSRSSADARRAVATDTVCFRQADCGEYLRDEDNLFASG